MTEEAILQGCLENKAAAQKELYQKYSSKMLAVCYRYAHNREDAEDMLQEGFIKVFSQIHSFENRGALEGWIRRIVVHTCINILKKNKKFNESVDLIHATALQVREDTIPSIIQAKQVVESCPPENKTSAPSAWIMRRAFLRNSCKHLRCYRDRRSLA